MLNHFVVAVILKLFWRVLIAKKVAELSFIYDFSIISVCKYICVEKTKLAKLQKTVKLEIRYKNDSTKEKNWLVLKLPRYGEGKKHGNFKTSRFFGSVESVLFCLSSDFQVQWQCWPKKRRKCSCFIWKKSNKKLCDKKDAYFWWHMTHSTFSSLFTLGTCLWKSFLSVFLQVNHEICKQIEREKTS